MAQVFTIPTKFTAIDGMSPVIGRMSHNIYSYTERANNAIARQERLFRKMVPGIGSAAKNLLNYATAGAGIAAAAFSAKGIMDYETAIQSLQAVTGVSDEQLKGFKAEIVDTAAKTKKSATDIAGSFEVVGSMMSQYLTDPKALKLITEAGITLSKASRQELVPTLENLTSIMNQFNLKAEDSNDVINRLTAGEIVGSLRTAQVADALKMFGANAETANVSLGESVALVEALAKQRPVEHLGVDSRNLLIVLSAAKALDKKAKSSLRKNGVDMDFLADKSKSLSARLHELSKIQGDNVGMVRVFGERNVTAAKVIFNQLPTYDQFADKIKVTNEAQTQAIQNSKTFAQSIDRLKNTFLNYISTSDKTAVGLEKLRDLTGFVTDNMDMLVGVGVRVVEVFAAWKVGIIAMKTATTAWSVAMGISNFVTGASIGLLEEDAIAQRVSMLAKTANGIATRGLTANLIAMNTALAANPIGLVTVGILALAGGIYLLSEREKDLYKQYQDNLKLHTADVINKESDAVRKLAKQYIDMGDAMDKAVLKSIKFNKHTIDFRRIQSEQRIKKTKADLEDEKNKFGVGDVLGSTFGGEKWKSGKQKKLEFQLAEQEHTANQLAEEGLMISNSSKAAIDQGLIEKKDLGNTFNTKKQKTFSGPSFWGDQGKKQGEDKLPGFGRNAPSKLDYAMWAKMIGDQVGKVIKDSLNINVNTDSGNKNASKKSLTSVPASY